MVKRRASYYLHDWYYSVSNISNHFWLKFLYDTYDGSYRYHANFIEKKNGIVGCAEMIISQQIITIALCIFGTMLTRFLPFIIFSVKRKIPEFVNYIGRYSPPSIWNVGYILSEGCSVLTGKLWHFEDDFYTSYHYPTCMEAYYANFNSRWNDLLYGINSTCVLML